MACNNTGSRWLSACLSSRWLRRALATNPNLFRNRLRNKYGVMPIGRLTSSNKRNKSELPILRRQASEPTPYRFDLGRAQTANRAMDFTSGNSQTSCCRDTRSTRRVSWNVPRRPDETINRKTPERKKTNGKLDEGW